MHRLAAQRLVLLTLAAAGLAALPALATPVTGRTAAVTAPPAAPVFHPAGAPVLADARHAPRPAPRPVADPPGFESLWFVGVFQ